MDLNKMSLRYVNKHKEDKDKNPPDNDRNYPPMGDDNPTPRPIGDDPCVKPKKPIRAYV